MTPEEIHNIWLHMIGKAEGLLQARGTADFPVLCANAILEFERLTQSRRATCMCGKPWRLESVHRKKTPCFDYIEREWIGLTGFEQKELMAMSARDAVFATEVKLKKKNT